LISYFVFVPVVVQLRLSEVIARPARLERIFVQIFFQRSRFASPKCYSGCLRISSF